MSDRTDIEVPATGLLPETPAPVAQTEGDRPLPAREQMMQKIIANYERQRETEMGHWDELPKDAPDVREQHAATRLPNASLGEVEADRDYEDPYAVEDLAEPAVAVPSSVVAPSTAAPEPQPTPAPVASPHTIAVDVGGQQLHVTQEQLVHLARIGAITNQTLYQYQTQGYQPPQQPPAPPQQAPIVDDERVRQTVKAIQYGDEASAAQALTDLVNHVSRGVPQVDLNQIEERVAERTRREIAQAAMQQQTISLVQQEYSDVIANPILADAAARQLQLLRQQNIALGGRLSEFDLVREAGNRVRSAFAPQSQPASQSPVDTGTSVAPQAPNIVVRRSAGEIDARKRAAPRAMSQVIDRRSAAPQAPRAPSPSDIVEMMRAKRGQTSMK